jgi:NADP-dependent alcohol dehydrogenase
MMENFIFANPTRIVFGQGQISELASLIPAGEKILITYGGGSIKANGVLDQVNAALKGRPVAEFGGIQPNPLYETLMEAVKAVKKQKITYLLAVGGGSVLDGTKFIAAAARFKGPEPWDILCQGAPVESALPVGAVLTLPATGSESNGFAVISRQSSVQKLPFFSELCFPKFAILDPAVTYSLPTKQVRNGIVDACAHVMEQYATFPADAPLQDRQAEAILLTLIEEGPKCLSGKKNYAARANLVWSATQALNGLIACGVPQDWATHMIGHELTALYGLDHAETLAVIMPPLLRSQAAKKRAKLAQFGRRVWGIAGADDVAVAEKAIRKMEKFYHSIGMPTKLADYGIDSGEASKKISERFAARDAKLGEHAKIDHKAVRKILAAC